MAHAACIFVDDFLELRAAIHDLEQLVGLLLILDNREAGFSVLEHVLHFIGDRVLIHRHRRSAQCLRGGHCPVKLRSVVADDGEAVATLEAV